MQQVDLVIRSGRLYTMNADRTVYADGAIAIQGDEIVAVGPTHTIDDVYEGKTVLNARDQAILPGLIDTHIHPVLNLRPGLGEEPADGFGFQAVAGAPEPTNPLDESVLPDALARAAHREHGANLDAFFAEAGILDIVPPVVTYSLARHSLMCAVRAGATTFIEGGGGSVEGVAEAALSIGMRAGVGYPAFDQLVNASSPQEGMQRIRDTEAVLVACEEAAKRWHGQGEGLLSSWLVPTVDVAASDELLAGLRQLMETYDLPVMAHSATTLSHDPYSQHHYGKTCIQRMADAGLMEHHWLGIHMGFFNDGDLDLLLSKPAHIAHCPSTSAKCGKGIMANGVLLDAMRKGVNVGLGSDTPGNGNMVREMQMSVACHRDGLGDSRALPPYKALEMATRDGARAAALGGKTGELCPGMKADVITLDTSRPEYDNQETVNALLSLGHAGDVCHSIINGRIVMQDRRFPGLDEEEVRRDMRAANAVISQMMGG